MAAPRPEQGPPPWWHPLRSDPALTGGLGLLTHGLAVLGALLGTIALGLLVSGVGVLFDALGTTWGGALAGGGLVIGFAVVLSWVGHLPGAAILHLLLRRGYGGWFVALLGGLAMGVLFGAFGFWIAVGFAPVLAVIHLTALRWIAWRRRGKRAAPGG